MLGNHKPDEKPDMVTYILACHPALKQGEERMKKRIVRGRRGGRQKGRREVEERGGTGSREWWKQSRPPAG